MAITSIPIFIVKKRIKRKEREDRKGNALEEGIRILKPNKQTVLEDQTGSSAEEARSLRLSLAIVETRCHEPGSTHSRLRLRFAGYAAPNGTRDVIAALVLQRFRPYRGW